MGSERLQDHGGASGAFQSDQSEDHDLSDFLEEVRVLIPGAQTLTAFLIILPFNTDFSDVGSSTRYVYMATFLCSVCSLILFTAPAAIHRQQRPLRDREGFKNLGTRLVIVGLIALSFALMLSTQLVMSELFGDATFAWVIAGIVALVIALIWWTIPHVWPRKDATA